MRRLNQALSCPHEKNSRLRNGLSWVLLFIFHVPVYYYSNRCHRNKHTLRDSAQWPSLVPSSFLLIKNGKALGTKSIFLACFLQDFRHSLSLLPKAASIAHYPEKFETTTGSHRLQKSFRRCALRLFTVPYYSVRSLDEKSKVALNPMYRMFLNFAKSCILSCLSKICNQKKFHRAVFEI